MMPVSCFFAVFFFGIDELGIQIEEPLSIIPLEGMCDGIRIACMEMVAREQHDSGLQPIGEDAKQYFK